MPTYNDFNYTVYQYADGNYYQKYDWGYLVRITATDTANDDNVYKINVGSDVAVSVAEAKDLIEVKLDKLRDKINTKLSEGKEIFRALSLKHIFIDDLKWSIQYIRDNPDINLNPPSGGVPSGSPLPFKTAFDTYRVGSIFTSDKFVNFVSSKIGDVTWNQFKTYCINKTFRELQL